MIDEVHLVRLLRNKLTGYAYLAVEDETHETVDRLFDSLKATFGSVHTPNFYREQLSIIFKKHNEHILDYIARVKDLRNAIIEGDQKLFGQEFSPAAVAQIDFEILEAFFEGLPPEYRSEIRLAGYCSLAEVYSKAIIVSKRIERDRTRIKDARTQPAPRLPEQNL